MNTISLKSLCLCALLTLTLQALTMLAFPLLAVADIYVVHNPDGSITFTNRQPSSSAKKVEVFSPGKTTFTRYYSSIKWMRGWSSKKAKLFEEKFHDLIMTTSANFKIDPSLVKAVIHAESAFNPRAKSPKGAMGLMQLMPGTARLVGVRNPWEPSENIHGGVRYLAGLLTRYGGDLRRAVAAYNAGPGAVDDHNGIPPYAETRLYVQKVMALHHAYRASSKT